MQDGPSEFASAFRRKRSSMTAAPGNTSRPEILISQKQQVKDEFSPIKEVR